jgi:tripartite-type tricarboxylate transporter receptor subunit TctC
MVLIAGLLRDPAMEPPVIDDGSNTQDTTASFYKGKTIKLIVPYDPGGGYDDTARLIIPYLEKYTGARVDIYNLPGAGGLRGANELFNSPRNGLTIGILNGAALITNQLAGVEGAIFRIEEFDFLGRTVADTRVLMVSRQSGFNSFEDIMQSAEPVRIGSSGLGASAYVDAVISREAFKLNLDIIHGFDSSSVIRHAMLRGDIDGTWGSWGSARDGVNSNLEKVVLQSGKKRAKDLADVPTVFDILNETTGQDGVRAMLQAWDALAAVGRPLAVPPGISPIRLRFLRNAVRQASQDPDLLKKAEDSGRPLQYASTEELGDIIREATMMDEQIKQLFIQIFRGEI